ncbi:hypothetical protein [Rothia koreensis]|uniref:hypothetical protein n=1 Tax=Rothia koreensis TaxID=592378 RepID=UPI003FCEDB8C
MSDFADWRNLPAEDLSEVLNLTAEELDVIYPRTADQLLYTLEQTVCQELAQWRSEKNLSAGFVDRGFALVLAVMPRLVRKEFEQFRELRYRLIGVLTGEKWE